MWTDHETRTKFAQVASVGLASIQGERAKQTDHKSAVSYQNGRRWKQCFQKKNTFIRAYLQQCIRVIINLLLCLVYLWINIDLNEFNRPFIMARIVNLSVQSWYNWQCRIWLNKKMIKMTFIFDKCLYLCHAKRNERGPGQKYYEDDWQDILNYVHTREAPLPTPWVADSRGNSFPCVGEPR